MCVISPKFQTSKGYCLCVLAVHHNHKQWEVIVCVCYLSKIITDIERLTVYVFYQSKIITDFESPLLRVLRFS